MAEPLEMPNIDAIVESIRVARRSEEGARMFVSLSVPVKEAPQLLSFLAASLKNPVRVGFTEMQARLPEGTAKSVTITGPDQKIETITFLTTVDGQPAEVTLPVRAGGRRNEILPHPFKADPENASKCSYCSKGEGYQAHDQARIDAAARAKANGHKPTPAALAAQGEAMLQRHAEAYGTPHAFVPREQDDGCEACGHGADDAVHVQADAEIPEHLRKAAESLISAAAETEAVPSA